MNFSKTKEQRTGLTWAFVDPTAVNPEMFGLDDVIAVKVKRHSGERDVRSVSIPGWRTFAEFTNHDPLSGEELPMTEWFVFAAKGRERGCVL
jgi:hypothetical protein